MATLLLAGGASARREFLAVARRSFDYRSDGSVESAACSMGHASGGPPGLDPFVGRLRRAIDGMGAEAVTPATSRSSREAADSFFQAIVSGSLAWRFEFGGAALEGYLLLHLVGASFFAGSAWAMLLIGSRGGEPSVEGVTAGYFGVAAIGLLAGVITGHLGGVLRGVAS